MSSSTTSPGDTIAVAQHRTPAVEMSPSDGDVEMAEADDEVPVEEYDFSNEPEVEDEDEDDDGRDTMWYKKRVTIDDSSDEEHSNAGTWQFRPQPWREEEEFSVADTWQLTHRPWRRDDFSREARIRYEKMYANLINYPMHNDWDISEAYTREKDKEMLRYIEDFPLDEWFMPRDEAQKAYDRLLERTRWRGLGIRIYGNQRIPDLVQGSNNAFQSFASQAVQMQPLPMRQQMAHRAPSHAMAMGPQNSPVPQMPRDGAPPPPGGVLRSQPHIQPTQIHSNGKQVSQMGPPSMPSRMSSQTSALASPAQNNSQMRSGNREPRNEALFKAIGRLPESAKAKPSKPITSPSVNLLSTAPRVPPYSKPEKPAEPASAKKGRNHRRNADADELPWHRDIDFTAARANASWDMRGYDAATLASMAATRKRNEAILEQIDAKDNERQRMARTAKKQSAPVDGVDGEKPKKRRGRASLASEKPATSDVYHSGSYTFASDDDAERATALDMKNPDEIMDAYRNGKVSLDLCAQFKICWNPGKRGIGQGLQQAVFSIKDSIITKDQLDATLILTRQAAECIVDFIPDLLWRSLLLRLVSEAGFGNKDIRDRMCLNGNYCDKATITKRIGAALGQKQQQAAAKNRKKKADDPSSDPSEPKPKSKDTFYTDNHKQYVQYSAWFGLRMGHTSKHRSQQPGVKRKLVSSDAEMSGAEEDVPSAKKRVKPMTDTEAGVSSEDNTASEAGSEMQSEDDESDADAVSIQSDTILDAMDED